MTAVEIHFSSQVGLLAQPPFYDGIGYVLVAKSSFYVLQAGGLNPEPLSHALSYFTFAPLWEALMLLGFCVFGEGEWQTYTIRFWPTLLLLLLMFWVVRRRGCATVAWLAVLFTALLPTISVSLRTSGREYFSDTKAFGSEWYLADLRPDLLFAVLLLWTVVPLIERMDNLNRRTWLVSGTAAALAILAKSSTTPVLLLAGGLTVLYVLIVNRHRFRATVATATWGLVPFVILLLPWVLVGGPRTTITYLYQNLTVGRQLWSNPNATFFSEVTLYWRFYPYHMGLWEGWLFLLVGLALSVARTNKKRKEGGGPLLVYLLVAGALYGLVSATPSKNLFVGLPYYLLLWLFSWAVLAPFMTAFSQRGRAARRCLILSSILYGSAVGVAGFYALHFWPAEKSYMLQENRVVTQRIARDLRSLMGDEDTFMWVPAYGYPASLHYYMMDSRGNFPQGVEWDPTTAPPVPRFLEERVGPCQVVLVFEQDVEEVAQYFWMHPLTYPYWRGIADWTKQPKSPFRLLRTYRLWGQFPQHPLTVQLYVKEPELAVSVDGGGWPSRVQFNHGPYAGHGYALSGPSINRLFRSDFDTLSELQINRYGEVGGLGLTPAGLAGTDVAGRYESGDNRDHLASSYVSPQNPDADMFFFSAWVRPQDERDAPALWLQDENFTFLSRAQVRLRRPDGWILLVGFAEKGGAGQVRLVVMEPPGTMSLIDKMMLVEASRE